MEKVAVATLKAHLSRYLKAVQAGEQILITDRGKPVALLGPVRIDTRGNQTRTAELIRAGLARPPLQGLPEDFWELPRPNDPGGYSLAALIEERAEGR